MIATTGAQLLPPEALRELRENILPRATVVTPNIPEARMLLADAGYGHLPLNSVDDLEVMAKAVHSLGSEWALVKGGHQAFKSDYSIASSPEESKIVVDVLHGRGKTIRIEREYQNSRNTHGTGCSLACKEKLFGSQACKRSGEADGILQLPSLQIWREAWTCRRPSRPPVDMSRPESSWLQDWAKEMVR